MRRKIYKNPMITRYRFGKDVPEISPHEIKSIPIPKLTWENQSSVAQHIESAYKNVDEAKNILYN